MAQPEDYVGKTFGSFQILRQLGHGAEAEVFLCVDSRSQRGYVLRLAIADDVIWDGAPLVPPVNHLIERRNAIGSWHAKLAYEKSLHDRLAAKRGDTGKSVLARLFSGASSKGKATNFSIHVPTVYGVLQQQYLVPISDPYRLTGTLSVLELLAVAPADDLYLFEAWEDIALQILGDADGVVEGSLSLSDWRARWSKIAFGPILKSALSRYMKGGSLNAQTQGKVLNLIPDAEEGYSEFARGLILRLIGATARGRCTLDTALRTLRCRYFRENISWQELEQMVEAFGNLRRNSFGADTTIGVIQRFLVELGQPVFDLDANPEEYSCLSEQASVDDYELFLQEFAGDNAPLPHLEVSGST